MWPNGIDVYDDQIYVVDTDRHDVQVFDLSGNFLFKFGSRGSGQGQFYNPWYLDIADSKVYVTDVGNNRVQVFDTEGTFLSAFGSYGTGDGQFKNPHGIRVANGKIYVGDHGGPSVNSESGEKSGGRVSVFDLDGTFIESVLGLDDTQEYKLEEVNGIAISDDGLLYVCECPYPPPERLHRVQVFCAG